jgi:hypothetical protein
MISNCDWNSNNEDLCHDYQIHQERNNRLVKKHREIILEPLPPHSLLRVTVTQQDAQPTQPSSGCIYPGDDSSTVSVMHLYPLAPGL